MPFFLTLAKIEAGCELDNSSENEYTECEGKVHGFKPSSLISISATVSGILSCFLLPFLGAVVDYTRRRYRIVSSKRVSSMELRGVDFDSHPSTSGRIFQFLINRFFSGANLILNFFCSYRESSHLQCCF